MINMVFTHVGTGMNNIWIFVLVKLNFWVKARDRERHVAREHS